VWATLIALMDGDTVAAGLVSAPALHRRWWAASGTGGYTGKSLSSASRLAVSAVSDLDRASLSYSSLGGWGKAGLEKQFLELNRSVLRARGFGDFWSYMLVAEGAVDIAAEPEVLLHDLAAPAIIVTEAGGRFTDLSGKDGPAGGNAVASNGLLHDEVLGLLSPS
jgi:histidinol-phosphatase